MRHDHQGKAKKEHAHLRSVRLPRPLWVYDPEDWEIIRASGGQLICPVEECRFPLDSVQNGNGTRFLRNKGKPEDCVHAFGYGRGGGPMSQEHRWIQNRILGICRSLGYTAVPEHAASRADVWVEAATPLAIEVQRWPTTFVRRTEARRAAGADVLWLLTESATGTKVPPALFEGPAARIRVLAAGSRKPARPWEPGFSGQALLYVGATVLKLKPERMELESAQSYDAKEFLREVLSGARKWFPTETGFPYSGWALASDVEVLREARSSAARARLVAVASRQAQPAEVETEIDPPAGRERRPSESETVPSATSPEDTQAPTTAAQALGVDRPLEEAEPAPPQPSPTPSAAPSSPLIPQGSIVAAPHHASTPAFREADLLDRFLSWVTKLIHS